MASSGTCISTEMGRAKPTSRMNIPTDRIVNTTAAPPRIAPICSGRFSPRYRAMRTVTPIASCVTTKVTRFKIWLPVETAESPAVEPNWPTTSKSTAP